MVSLCLRRRCTELKSGWAKGWSRLGAAYFGLEQFSEVGCIHHGCGLLNRNARSQQHSRRLLPYPCSRDVCQQSVLPHPPIPTLTAPPHPKQAREAYERACKLEPSDSQLQVALQKALAREAKQVGRSAASYAARMRLCHLAAALPGQLAHLPASSTLPAHSQIAEHKHTFHKRIRDDEEEGGGGRGHEGKRPQATVPAAAAKKKKTLLSFGEDEEEEG